MLAPLNAYGGRAFLQREFLHCLFNHAAALIFHNEELFPGCKLFFVLRLARGIFRLNAGLGDSGEIVGGGLAGIAHKRKLRNAFFMPFQFDLQRLRHVGGYFAGKPFAQFGSAPFGGAGAGLPCGEMEILP